MTAYCNRIARPAQSDEPGSAWDIWNDRGERIILTADELAAVVASVVAFAQPEQPR